MHIAFKVGSIRIVSFFIIVVVFIALVFIATHNHYIAKTVKAAGSGNIVGTWYVNAIGAPFQPHVATFHGDGTMEIDNPEAGDPHTSDSVGMGPWIINQNSNGNVINGKFEEINANRTTNQFDSNLIVTYTLTVNGNTFSGPAVANYYDANGNLIQGPFPATLNGTRITLP